MRDDEEEEDEEDEEGEDEDEEEDEEEEEEDEEESYHGPDESYHGPEGAHTAGYEGISLEATNTTITEEQHDVEASGGDDDGDDEGDAGSLEIWDEDGAHHSLPDSSEILAAGKEGAVDSG